MFAVKAILVLSFICKISCEFSMLPTYEYVMRSPSSGAVSRQIFDMIDIVTDVAMLTLIGIPIIGLVAIGANAIAPLLTSKKESDSGPDRSKREAYLFSKFGPTLRYVNDFVKVLIKIDEAFTKYGIHESECQLKIVCEAHQTANNSKLAKSLLEMLSFQRKLIESEYIPIAKFMFNGYETAARNGEKNESCTHLYSQCPFNLNYFATRKAI